MTYAIRWDAKALGDLKDISKAEAIRLVKKISTHLVLDPLNLGKPLRGELSGLYRYRIANYRVIYEIRKQELIIVIVRIGHRKDVYED